MAVISQIILGSTILIICGLLHISLAAVTIRYLTRRRPLDGSPSTLRFAIVTACIFGAFLTSHTVHVYLWAFAIWGVGALPGYEAPIYFGLVTYTTLGYGDVILAPEFRIFGAMASVTGILMFGLTTAFLVGVFSRALAVGRNSEPNEGD